MVEPISPPSTPRWRRLLPWIVGSMVVLAVAACAIVVIAVASLFSGTSLTREDFTTAADATEFVSGHLPVPLPASAAVERLTYERFTDWHLQATVDLGSSEAVDLYLQKAREHHEENVAYCGSSNADGRGVSYFLPEWHACGTVVPGPGPGFVAVHCNTR